MWKNTDSWQPLWCAVQTPQVWRPVNKIPMTWAFLMDDVDPNHRLPLWAFNRKKSFYVHSLYLSLGRFIICSFWSMSELALTIKQLNRSYPPTRCIHGLSVLKSDWLTQILISINSSGLHLRFDTWMQITLDYWASEEIGMFFKYWLMSTLKSIRVKLTKVAFFCYWRCKIISEHFDIEQQHLITTFNIFICAHLSAVPLNSI